MVQKASVQSPDHMVVPPSLVDSELDHETGIAKQTLEVQQLEELIEKRKGYFINNVDPSSKTQVLAAAKRALARLREEHRGAIEKQIRQKLRDQAEHRVALLEDEKAVLEKQKSALEQEVSLKSRDAEQIGKTSFELETRRSEIEQTESVIRSLRTEKERLNVEINIHRQRVQLISDAEPPQSPNRSAQVQLALAGGMGFFLMTLAGISYWELRFHRISGSEEIIQDLGMRVIGSLPIMSDQSRGLRNNGDGVPDFDALVLDSIDAIRTMLLCDDSNNSHRILMVTSAKGREGKTTLASHLATSIARTGRKTLLVDCDLRRPSVHRLFGAEVQAGLSEVLGGEVDIAHAIIPSPIRDLSLLQAGRQTRETIPALAQNPIRLLFGELRARFDFIIIDSCPILPVADALLVGKNVDGVLFSVRPHVSQTPMVSAAFERLSVLGIRVLGVVINGRGVDVATTTTSTW